MQIKIIKDILQASLLTGEEMLETHVDHIYASDLMSDVLAFGKPNSILLTGLATRQAIISAHMAEFDGVVLIRGKKPKDGSEKFAQEHNLILLSTEFDMYDACVKISSIKDNQPISGTSILTVQPKEEIVHSQQFNIEGNDFANAGMVSTDLKSILKKIGLDPKLIRNVAIATYESEMNVIMHADRGKILLSVTPKMIEVTIEDEGKGIPDIDLAMQKGFTTATEEMRAMGFGSGMGLPNIDKNADDMVIESTVGKGTKLILKFYIN